MEIDDQLTDSVLNNVLHRLGAKIYSEPSGFEAWLPHGLRIVSLKSDDEVIHAEDNRGLNFNVSRKLYIPMKGKDPVNEAKAFVQALSRESTAFFIGSFQLETIFCWRDANGLHWA